LLAFSIILYQKAKYYIKVNIIILKIINYYHQTRHFLIFKLGSKVDSSWCFFSTYFDLEVKAASCVFKDVVNFGEFVGENKWSLMRKSFSVRPHRFHAFAAMEMAVGPGTSIWNILHVFRSTLIEQLVFSKGCFYHGETFEILPVEDRILGVQRPSVKIVHKVKKICSMYLFWRGND
jgi:hypothetical protein